jgi:hypothetical protein
VCVTGAVAVCPWEMRPWIDRTARTYWVRNFPRVGESALRRQWHEDQTPWWQARARSCSSASLR